MAFMDQFGVSHTMIKFLVLVSLFSLLLSWHFLLFQSLTQTQFFNFTISKNHIFVLCNALLVFISKNSGLSCASSTSTPEIGKSESEELDIAANEVKAEQEEEKRLMMEDLQKEEEIADTQEEEDEEKEEERNAVMIIEADDEEDEDEAEELNKKCEDFIRRMKAGFYSEPRAYDYDYDYDYNFNYKYNYSDVDHQKV